MRVQILLSYLLFLWHQSMGFMRSTCKHGCRSRFPSRMEGAATPAADISAFHHIEICCGDAKITSNMFKISAGLEEVAKSDLSTGNMASSAFVLQSGQVRMLLTAPGSSHNGKLARKSHNTQPIPWYSRAQAHRLFQKHGLFVRAVGVCVNDVTRFYEGLVNRGGKPLVPPTVVHDRDYTKGSCTLAEVLLYGDVCLRLVDDREYKGAFLPNFNDVVNPGTKLGKYGIERIDHIVGNVHCLQATLKYIQNMTGFHEFAEFTAEDVGTVDSGLNSAVLANDNEMVLLPVNEPTFGTKRKSQIQTYLEQNQGEGVQHIALHSSDIFATLQKMQAATAWGGFEFMPGQGPAYYERVKKMVGEGVFTDEQWAQAETMGLLVDKDDQGILLQIFTKPLGDRPTIFFEIIQRVGCVDGKTGKQKPGCGGFGKGNFRDLFKSIEDYESTLGINSQG